MSPNTNAGSLTSIVSGSILRVMRVLACLLSVSLVSAGPAAAERSPDLRLREARPLRHDLQGDGQTGPGIGAETGQVPQDLVEGLEERDVLQVDGAHLPA